MVPILYKNEMKKFADTYGFILLMSSPHYPQSNQLAERTFQTIKELLQDSSDPYLALLSFRITPILWCSFSPAELLMGRQSRTDIPTPKNQLILYLIGHTYRNFERRTTNTRLGKGDITITTQSKVTRSTSPRYLSVDENRMEPNNWSHPIPSKYTQI